MFEVNQLSRLKALTFSEFLRTMKACSSGEAGLFVILTGTKTFIVLVLILWRIEARCFSKKTWTLLMGIVTPIMS